MRKQILNNEPKETQAIIDYFRSLGLSADCTWKDKIDVKIPNFNNYVFYINYESLSADCNYYDSNVWQTYSDGTIAQSAFDNLSDALS